MKKKMMTLISMSIAALMITGMNPVTHKSVNASEATQNVSAIENNHFNLTGYKLVNTMELFPISLPQQPAIIMETLQLQEMYIGMCNKIIIV